MKAKTNTHKKHNPLLLVLMRALYRVGERLLRLQQADPWVGASSGCWRALDPRRHKVMLMCQGEQKPLCLQPCSAGNAHLHS